MFEVSFVDGLERVAEIEKNIKERMEKLYHSDIGPNKRHLAESELHYKFRAIAVDASNIKVELEYTDSYHIKCADNNGKIYLNAVIPSDMPEDIWEKYKEEFRQIQPIKQLFEFLEVSKWEDLSYLGNVSGDSDGSFIHVLRDVVEWAALIQVLIEETNCIILKDGLLRNKTFKYEKRNSNNVYFKLKNKLKQICQERENIVVGIAKSGKLLSIVKDIINPYFDTEFSKPFTIIIPNNSEIMKLSYNYVLYREGEIVFGNNLYVTSFLKRPQIDRLCMIEIPEWEEHRAIEILQVLYTIGIRRLPIHVSGLPIPVVHAHEKSKVTQLYSFLIASEVKRRVGQ